MAINPIKILDEVLQGVSLTVNVSAIVDNGGGSYTLTVDNTYYLNRLSKITIDAVEYTVTDFTINTELVVSGDSLPTATSFTINQPLFLYGNPQMVSAEIVKRQENGTLTYPYIWAVEISTTSKNLNPSAAVKATKSFNLFFFDTVDRENWVIEDHYNQDIYPLSNYIDYFFTILKSRRDLFDSDSITWNETNHVNFGDYIQDQGNREKILNDNITGIQVQAEVPFMAQGCGFTSVTKNCLPVSVTFNGSSVTPTQSGGVKNVVVVNNAVPSVQVGNVTLDNENNLNIEVPAAGGGVASSVLNGANLTDTPAGQTKTLTIQQANGDPVTITTVTDTANSFEGTVPNCPISKIKPFRNPINTCKNADGNAYINSYLTGDMMWHVINGTFDWNDTISESDIVQKQDPTDIESILYDDSSVTGISEHKKRFVGPNGGYFLRNVPPNFFDRDGNPITRDELTEDPSYPGTHWIIDRLTWTQMLVYEFGAKGKNLTDSLSDVAALNKAGHSDWRIQTRNERLRLLFNQFYDVWQTSPSSVWNYPESFSLGYMWTCSPNYNQASNYVFHRGTEDYVLGISITNTAVDAVAARYYTEWQDIVDNL
jgi:hypothetical protein